MDALSRLPVPPSNRSREVPEPEEIVLLVNQLNNGPVSARDKAKATTYDPVLSKVMNFVMRGWPNDNKDDDLTEFFKRKDEISTDQGLLLWGQRVIIPPKLQSVILMELHDCHPGMVKMKGLARSYVWWPGIDKRIEQTVKECDACQVHGNSPAASQMYPWEWPMKHWQRLHLDYGGPIDKKMILIIVDAGTKFIEAHTLTSATSENTIEKLRQTFATHGLPQSIVSDNGTPFKSEIFSEFCKLNGIRQIFVSPYRPASNGMAERAVQVVKNGLKKTKETNESWRPGCIVICYIITRYHKVQQVHLLANF